MTGRIERDPAYKRHAAAAFLERYEQVQLGEQLSGYERDRAYRASLDTNIRRPAQFDLLDERMLDRYDLADLAAYLEPDRDALFDYMDLETLEQRYFLSTEQDGERLELSQTFWMRVAMGLALEEDEPQRRAREFYDVLSKLEFTPSTPTLLHSGTAIPPASVVLSDNRTERSRPHFRVLQAPRHALEMERRARQ